MVEVLGGLAVFAAVIAVGWALVRSGAVDARADAVLTRLCFFAATPAFMVTTLAAADLTAVLSAATAASVGAELIGIVSAWLVHRLVLRHSVAEATIGALASGYVNAANLGIPVLVLVAGDAAPIAPILLLQLLVLTPATFAVLDTVTRRGNPSRLATYTIPLRNPLVLSVVAGTVLNLAGVDLPGVLGGHLYEFVDLIGRTAVPLMMLALGMSLAASGMRVSGAAPTADGSGGSAGGTGATAGDGRGSGRALGTAVAWKLLVLPALALGLGLALGLRGGELLVPVTTASLPTAQNVFMYASRYGAAKSLARDSVLLTTAGFVPVVLLATALLG
ncbi:MAG: AEC family transporter [Actinomyces sp.]|uniref:AEC family transporter n=1 Tax=Actinomyces sp. TaxID=29317 RepID=UPI0026DD0C89|nr:AEC family transporter [Actinomyces sp.]MDO4244353.1 AEC family transporter [Actinomyces sp.]